MKRNDLMKKRLLAALSAAVLMSAQAVYAAADWNDYGYDYDDYGYENYDNNDYGYGYEYDENDDYYEGYDENGTDSSTSSEDDDVPLVDPMKDTPVTVKLVPTKIVDKKFSVDLYFESSTDIISSDLTITYDSNVLKLNKSKVNKSMGETIAAAETTPGKIQFQYSNPNGSSSSSEAEEEPGSESSETDSGDDNAIAVEAVQPSYLTLDFEVVDVTERSSVLYIEVNSLRDRSSTELTYRADGTIIQIEGAVPVDPSADESMFTELRVALSDMTISYESLGLTNVKQVTFAESDIAAVGENGINTLSYGLTNMTVEFTDGSFKYYRLVVSENVPTGMVLTSEPDSVTDIAAEGDPGNVGEIIKTETRSSSRVKYLIIYILVLIAIIAVFVEYFMFFGNPYSKTLALMKARSAEKAAMRAALEMDMLDAAENAEQSAEDAEQDIAEQDIYEDEVGDSEEQTAEENTDYYSGDENEYGEYDDPDDQNYSDDTEQTDLGDDQ